MNLAQMRRLIPLALAFALAGCGVKGALEPPPGSGIEANSTRVRTRPSATTPSELRADERALWLARRNRPENGATSRAVVTAPAAERSSPLDWLID